VSFVTANEERLPEVLTRLPRLFILSIPVGHLRTRPAATPHADDAAREMTPPVRGQALPELRTATSAILAQAEGCHSTVPVAATSMSDAGKKKLGECDVATRVTMALFCPRL